MITSMTGFGRACVEGSAGQVNIEIRSVNSRFLDIQIRCPQMLQSIEPLLRECLQKSVNRGKVSVNLSMDFFDQDSTMPVLNEKVVERYLIEAKRLKEITGIWSSGNIELGLFMQLPDVFVKESLDPQHDQLQNSILKGFEEATNEFVAMREREGQLLAEDIKMRIGKIRGILAGMPGAAEYEQMVFEYLNSVSDRGFINNNVPIIPGSATSRMSAQSIAHLLMVIFIVFGNISYYLVRREKN